MQQVVDCLTDRKSIFNSNVMPLFFLYHCKEIIFSYLHCWFDKTTYLGTSSWIFLNIIDTFVILHSTDGASVNQSGKSAAA